MSLSQEEIFEAVGGKIADFTEFQEALRGLSQKGYINSVAHSES